METITPYIGFRKSVSAEKYKLVCIPCAGYGASFYNGWQKIFGDYAEVLQIQLPGHESRISEPLITDCAEAASGIAQALYPYVSEGEFSVFGHSMGGILAYEVSKKLTEMGCCPEVCFISSTSIEDWSGVTPSLQLSDGDFFERVSRFGGIDKDSEILKYPEFRSVFMKILRADFSIIESYEYDGEKLSCPVLCMCGDSDPMETLENMKSWENYTDCGDIRYIRYSGDHFYLKDQPEKVCGDIKALISDCRIRRRHQWH